MVHRRTWPELSSALPLLRAQLQHLPELRLILTGDAPRAHPLWEASRCVCLTTLLHARKALLGTLNSAGDTDWESGEQPNWKQAFARPRCSHEGSKHLSWGNVLSSLADLTLLLLAFQKLHLISLPVLSFLQSICLQGGFQQSHSARAGLCCGCSCSLPRFCSWLLCHFDFQLFLCPQALISSIKSVDAFGGT